MANEIEERLGRRMDAPERLGSLMGRVEEGMAPSGGQGLQYRAFRAWMEANGSIERAATTGVFVKPPAAGHALPTLIVYVDTKQRQSDFTVNREIYAGRLRNWGMDFERILFKQSKYPLRRARAGAGAAKAQRPLPSLTVEEDAWAEVMASSLPASLRKSGLKAIQATLRVQKSLER